MYSIFAFLTVFSFRNITHRKASFFIIIFVFIFLFGMFMEFLQGFTNHRTPEVNDALANGFGVFVGIVIAVFIVRRIKKNKLIIN